MTIIDTGAIPFPIPFAWGNHNPQVLDSATDKYAFIFQAPKTGNIHKLHIGISAFVSAMTLDLRLETVDPSTGHPTGTLWGTNTNNTVAVSAIGGQSVTLTADAAVTKGDIIALVVAATTSGSVSVMLATGISVQGFPYASSKPLTSYTKTSSARGYGVVEYDDGSVLESNGLLPFVSAAYTSFTSASNPKTRGLRFKVPFPCKISGFYVQGTVTGGSAVTFRLYDSDGVTVLKTVTYDTDMNRNSAGAGITFFEFSSNVTLLANTYYRISISPDSNGYSLYENGVITAAHLDGFGFGQNGHLTTCNTTPSSESDWTQTLTTVPTIGIIIRGLDNGLGNKLVHPGMSGGMRG